jgi:hypothetical protein
LMDVKIWWIQHWSCMSEPTDHENSLISGSRIQHTVITAHCSQHRMKELSSSTSGSFGTILILDRVDVEKPHQYHASRHYCLQWHVQSPGWHYASFG